MKIIIGLGNPGREYASTRHNMGFMTIDKLAAKHGIDIIDLKHKGMCGKGMMCGEKVLLVKPQTYMNNLAGHTHNPKQLHQIAQKMQSISKTMAKRNLTPDECGLTAEDLSKAAKTMQKDQPKTEKKAAEKKAAAPVLQ